MTEKLVTHEDRTDLREVRDRIAKSPIGCDWKLLALLDRLIAAAEADAPPLPEGWVVLTLGSGTARAYYHRGGRLCDWTLGTPVGEVGDERFPRDRLTPLRPTVTEVEVEKAMLAAARAYQAAAPMRNAWDDVARAAFKAAGIEVQS